MPSGHIVTRREYLSEKSDSLTNSLVEKILNNVYCCYTTPSKASSALGEVGLEEMGQAVGLDFIHPRKRITVMILGNHSAGKSSFVNWYLQKKLQRTGMAVETKGFTVVTHGRRDQVLKGKSALQQHRHVELALAAKREPALTEEDIVGFHEYLTVHVSTSTSRDFPMVDFIDTPGLVDGGIVYPFNPNALVGRLAAVADLIFVFMDPHGSSTCTRTMLAVKELNDAKHYHKMRYFLTKADTVDNREDLTKLIVQLTKRLSDNLSNTHGLEVPTIWIPRDATSDNEKDAYQDEANSLYRLVDDIHEGIRLKVQTNMSQLQTDAELLIQRIEEELMIQHKRREKHRRWQKFRLLTWLILPVLFVISFLDIFHSIFDSIPERVRATDTMQQLHVHTATYVQFYHTSATYIGLTDIKERMLAVLAVFLIMSTITQIFACRIRNLAIKSARELDMLRKYKATAATMITFHDRMFREYSADAQVEEYSTATVQDESTTQSTETLHKRR